MSTSENLQEAFAGESQANRKYLAYAKKALQEGYPGIAKLFRAAAESETVHANAHLRAMKTVKTTKENLNDALHGEQFEFNTMYPKFVEQAREENESEALASFQNAMTVEQVHGSLYIEALSAVESGKDLRSVKIFVCGVCGNTVFDSVPVKCPVCSASSEKFTEVE